MDPIGGNIRVAAIRREGRIRAAFAMLLSGILSSLYLGSSFPLFLSSFLHFGTPIDHMISAGVLYTLALGLIRAGIEAIHRWKISRAELAPIRIPRIRLLVRQYGKQAGIKAETLSSGGVTDVRFSAVTVGRHLAVRIGRGALPLAKRNPVAFEFRVAHEIAHLASGDARRDHIINAVYLATALSVGVSFGSSLRYYAGVLIQAARSGGVAGLKQSWTDTLGFSLAANTALFSGILLVLWLERKSAMRMRELHADALAKHLTGSDSNTFNKANTLSRLDRIAPFLRLFWSHPVSTVRQASIDDTREIFRADNVLFFIQGYFGTLILETLLQLVFPPPSVGFATLAERRAGLNSFLENNLVSTLGLIVLFALFIACAHTLAVARLSAAQLRPKSLSLPKKIALLFWISLLVSVGALLCLGTSVGVLWDLKQQNWSIVSYGVVVADRLGVHAANLLVLNAVLFAIAMRAKPESTISVRLVLIGTAPVVSAFTLAAIYYL